MKILDLTAEEIRRIATAIRETTSDAMLKVIDGKSDQELVEFAIAQDAVRGACIDGFIIHFPRKLK